MKLVSISIVLLLLTTVFAFAESEGDVDLTPMSEENRQLRSFFDSASYEKFKGLSEKNKLEVLGSNLRHGSPIKGTEFVATYWKSLDFEQKNSAYRAAFSGEMIGRNTEKALKILDRASQSGFSDFETYICQAFDKLILDPMNRRRVTFTDLQTGKLKSICSP